MDFKDKVTEISKKAGKVATDTYNSVADKSGKLFEEAKARITISDKEREITKIYESMHYPIKSLKLPALIDFMENGTMEHQHHNKALKAIYAIKQNMQDEYTDDEIIDFIMEYGAINIGEVRTILRSIR